MGLWKSWDMGSLLLTKVIRSLQRFIRKRETERVGGPELGLEGAQIMLSLRWSRVQRITRITLMTEAYAVQNDSNQSFLFGQSFDWVSLASLHRLLLKVSIDIHLPGVYYLTIHTCKTFGRDLKYLNALVISIDTCNILTLMFSVDYIQAPRANYQVKFNCSALLFNHAKYRSPYGNRHK